jgi:hypothetical protein
MAHQPGFIEGPWRRFEYLFTVTVPAGQNYASGPLFTLNVNQEDVLRFAGGGILMGANDSSGALQLVTQRVYIQMQSGYLFVLPLYPPTQLNFPRDTFADGSELVLTLPPLEIPGEALGSGGWPTAYFGARFSVYNTGSTSHSYNVQFSLPYQIISRQRAV